jgi:hypothetical protein
MPNHRPGLRPNFREPEGLTPYLWLLLAAFLAAFVSFLALDLSAPAGALRPTRYAETASQAASAPASEDWNLPKHI